MRCRQDKRWHKWKGLSTKCHSSFVTCWYLNAVFSKEVMSVEIFADPQSSGTYFPPLPMNTAVLHERHQDGNPLSIQPEND